MACIYTYNGKQYDEQGIRKVLSEMTPAEAAPFVSGIDAVPNAPFKTSWPMLAMKTALRMAVDGGYDSVAWITGNQTRDRYSLGKSADEIIANKNDNGTYRIMVTKRAEGRTGPSYLLLDKRDATDEYLRSTIGKELTDKIVRQKNSVETYIGIDLKIGGEWAVNLYDKQIPNELNKYVKKWGGRVGETKIKTKAGAETEQHSLEITPEMRDAISLGQPQFSGIKRGSEKDSLTENRPTGPMSVSMVNKELTRIKGKLGLSKAIRFQIPATESDLPEDVLRRVEQRNARGRVNGIHDNGTIYIIANRMKSKVDLERVILHEITHYGAGTLFGSAKQAAYSLLWDKLGGRSGINKLSDAYGIDIRPYIKTANDRYVSGQITETERDAHLMDEFLARYNERRAKESWPKQAFRHVQEFFGAIRDALRKSGFVELSKVSNSDLAYLMKSLNDTASGKDSNAPRFIMEGIGQRPKGRDDSDNIAFSVGNDQQGKESLSESESAPAKSLVGDKFTIPPLTRFQKVIRKLQDESVVFKAVQDAVEKQGGTITEATNMSEAIKRYPGRLAAAMKDTTDNLVEPFMKRIHDAGTTMDEVALLAYAEFAPIRNAEIAKINDRFPNNGEPGKSGSGMTDIEAAEIVKQAKEHPNSEKLFALAEELRSIPERNLENRVAGGVMTQEQADEYTAKSPKYIPLKGFELADERGVTVGTGQGLSTGSKLDFRALGRSSRAGQIFENTIRDYEVGLQLVEKANVARTIREFVKANPDKKLWDVDNAPEKPYLHKGGVVYQVWSGDRVIVELASQKDAKAIVDGLKATDPDARLEEVRPSPNVHMRETQFDPTEEIRFIEDGKPVRIQLFNEDMTRSYNRLWHSGVSDGLKILNNYNSWLRQFYTQKNPAWFVMNALKDVQSVIPYVTGEAGAKVAMKVPGNLRGAFKAAWAMHHGLKAEGGWDETIKQFMNSGGYTGFSYVGDIEAQTLRLNGAIARHTPWDEAAKKFKTEGIKKGVAAVGAKVLNTRFFSWIESMNSTFENMTRLAVFKAGMDGGMTANEAGKLAKNASTNFNTRGEWGPNINAVWLFANAGIQGTRNVGHALLFSKHREQVWALMGGLAALGVMAGMMSDDDDDLLDDQLRSRYLAMKFGDSQVSIPMPYGFGFFAGFGQLVAQVIKHPEKQDQLAVKMASLAADHFSPFGNPLTDKLDMKNIVNIAPTFPKPFLNVAANVSPFGGAPLYPDSPFDTTRPDSEKMWTATRGSGYDVVAEWLNTLTGGDKVREGAVSVSPETLKLSVSTMFGGAGKLMSDMLSIPFDAANETLSAKKMPIIKNFYREIDKDAYLQRFYEEAKDAQDAYTTFRNYQKQGMVDDATAYRNEEAAYVSMGRLVTTYRKQIKRLKDMEAHINNSDASATEKNIGLAKTNKAIIETTSTFNDRLKSMN